jgi:hypothetical protein
VASSLQVIEDLLDVLLDLHLVLVPDLLRQRLEVFLDQRVVKAAVQNTRYQLLEKLLSTCRHQEADVAPNYCKNKLKNFKQKEILKIKKLCEIKKARSPIPISIALALWTLWLDLTNNEGAKGWIIC